MSMSSQNIQAATKKAWNSLATSISVHAAEAKALRYIQRAKDPDALNCFLDIRRWDGIFRDPSQPLSKQDGEEYQKMLNCFGISIEASRDEIEERWKDAKRALMPILTGSVPVSEQTRMDATTAFPIIRDAYHLLRFPQVRRRIREILIATRISELPEPQTTVSHCNKRWNRLSHQSHRAKKVISRFALGAAITGGLVMGLQKGKPSLVKLYKDSASKAKPYVEKGARWLHVEDLSDLTPPKHVFPWKARF